MVELYYKNKKPEKEIFTIAKKNLASCNIKWNCSKSYLLQGDNFLWMSYLLQNYKGKIDLVYIDPPFNTQQKFFVSENRANTISRSGDGYLAYDDDLCREDYLEFMRERFVLLRELLSDIGSIYVHIDYKVGHYIKIIMDEIFGEKNFKNDITRIKSNPKNFYRRAYGNEKDLILFYTKSDDNIWNDIKIPLTEAEIIKRFPKIDEKGQRYTTIPLHAPGETSKGKTGQPWRGIPVPKGRHWRTDPIEFDKLDEAGQIEWSSTGNPRIKKFAKDHKGKKIQDIWTFKDPQKPNYPTGKNQKMLEQIILQSSLPDSIVLDCFAGGGSTLISASKHNRKWIGIDSSQESINAIKKLELMDYEFININEI